MLQSAVLLLVVTTSGMAAAQDCFISRAGANYTYSPRGVESGSGVVSATANLQLPGWLPAQDVAALQVVEGHPGCGNATIEATSPPRLRCDLDTSGDTRFRIWNLTLYSPAQDTTFTCTNPFVDDDSIYVWSRPSVLAQAAAPGSVLNVTYFVPYYEIPINDTWTVTVLLEDGVSAPVACPVIGFSADANDFQLELLCEVPASLPPGPYDLRTTFEDPWFSIPTSPATTPVTIHSTDSTLASLAVQGLSLSPVFTPGTTSYAVTVPSATTTVSLSATRGSPLATMTINGQAASDGAPVNVVVPTGTTQVPVVVTSQAGTQTTYTVALTRAASTATTLASLTVTPATLAPAFSPGALAYVASVSALTETVQIAATRTSPLSTLTIAGQAAADGAPVTIAVGEATSVAIVVTAESGAQATYTVQIGTLGLAVSHAGYLLDGADQPITGTTAISFAIFGQPTGGTALWSSGACNVVVNGGYYAAALGSDCGESIPVSVLPAGATRWLEVMAAGITLTPRQRLGELPAARDAVLFAGRPVSSFVRFDGTNRLPAADSSQLSVATGAANGVMSAADKTKLDAVAVTSVSGTAPITVTGSGARTVGLTAPTAAGQYVRSTGANAWSIGAIQAGDVPDLGATYLKTSTNQAVGGDKTFSGTTTFSGAVSANAGLKLGNDAGACTTGKGGSLRWTGTRLELCNGAVWVGVITEFTPMALTGLRLWVRSDVGVTVSAGRVSQWADQSGQGNHFVQATAAKQPSLVASGLNGQPVLRLAASTTQTMTSTLSVGTPYTVAYVGRMNGPTKARVLNAVTNNWLLGWWGEREDQFFAEGWVHNPTTAATAAARLFVASGTGTTSTLWRNGTQLASNAAGVGAPIGLSLSSNVEPSDADVAEIVVYDRVLTTTERQQLELYLNSRYSLY